MDPNELMHGMLALGHSPAAIALANLAGELLFLNAKAAEFFGISAGTDPSGHNISDVCKEQPQLAALEAVARDGHERQFDVTLEVGGENGGHAEARRFTCRLSRVAGPQGIATWLAFVALQKQERDLDGGALYEAQALRIIHSLGGIAASTMRVQDRDNWLNNSVQWSAEVFSLLNAKPATVKPTSETYFEHIAPQDRQEVDQGMARLLAQGTPLEVLYRLNPKNGPPKVLFTRAAVAAQATHAAKELWFVAQDVTSLFAGQLLPREKAAVLDAFAACIEAPVYAVDGEFRYTYCNQFFRDSMRKVHGAAVVIGEKAYETVPSSARRRTVLSNLRRALHGARVVEEVSQPLDHSVIRHYELTYSPIVCGSQTIGVAVLGTRLSNSSVDHHAAR
jgi:PAS domain-containing protein